MSRLAIAASAAFLLAACDGNDNGAMAPVVSPQTVAFDEFLLEMLDPTNAAVEAINIEETTFEFPVDESAFAGLFP